MKTPDDMYASIIGANPIHNASNEDIARMLLTNPNTVYLIKIGFTNHSANLQSVRHQESGGFIAQCGMYTIYACNERSFVVTCVDAHIPNFPFFYSGSETERQSGVHIISQFLHQQERLSSMRPVAPSSAPTHQDIETLIAEGVRKHILENQRGGEHESRRGTEIRAQMEREDEIKAEVEVELSALHRREDEIKARHEVFLRTQREAGIKAMREAEIKAQQQHEANIRAQQQREADLRAQQQRDADLEARRDAGFRAQQQRDADLRAKRDAEIRAEVEAELRAQLPHDQQQLVGLPRRRTTPQTPPQTQSVFDLINNNQVAIGVVVVIVAYLFLHGQSLEHEIQAQRFQVARDRAYTEAFEQRAKDQIISVNREWESKYTRLHDETNFMRGEIMGRSKIIEQPQQNVRIADSESSHHSSMLPSLFSMTVFTFVIMGFYFYIKHCMVVTGDYHLSHSDDNDAIMYDDVE